MNSPPAAIHANEIRFHDEWAEDTDPASIDVHAAFEAPTALENRFILRLLGPLKGLNILDVGSGLGESSVYFALRGAHVTCTDVSPGMVDFAVRLARRHGVAINGVVGPAEELAVPEGAFDVVYLANIIHHVTDRESLFRSVRRALKPGGIFVSIDPLAYNPAIEVYRRMATEVRTEDELPLRLSDIRLASRIFPGLQHREFWIATLALFLKYYLFDRVHPNQSRYWKRILAETPESLAWWRPLAALDSMLTHLPLVRMLAWNTVLWAKKV